MYDAQRAFNRLAGDMPTFQWIETGPIKPTYCGGFKMTAQELGAEVWLAVAGGARGIGFFTHTWSPNHEPFDVAPKLQQAMKSITHLLRATQPGLVGKTVASGVNSPAIKLLARVGGNANYVFAVNGQPGWVKAQAYVPQLRNGRLEVVGEHRSVTVVNHRFSDSFSPLVAHLYVQEGPA